ncbi:MAG: 50S ribosomal protein L24, partial [Candidatus Thermoplasmatota archaeon]|nr:50S ribosomal protein L24 [Candidatus Thermoplasmatota archaeon]
MRSTKARKQKKAFFNAPLHQRRKHLSSHLEENLLLKYDKRNIPLIKGDTIKIMRGTFKGHENKVTKIHLKKHLVEVEGVTITKADGKQVAKPIHPSNLLITKLNLTDKWRRQRLEEGLSSETKKEIEKEASVQLKELDEERKAEEERQRLEEAEE